MPEMLLRLKRIKTIAAIVVLAFLPMLQVLGGWLIVEQKSDRFGNFGMQSTIISGQKVRIEHQTSTFIFNLDSNQTTIILPRQKVYWRGHHDSLGEALYRQLDIQISLMIAQLPEKERDKASEEMQFLTALMRSHQPDSLLPDHFRIVATDSVTRILNYQCRKYLFSVDSLVVEEIWMTSELKPWDQIDLRRLNQMMRLFNKPNLYSAYRVSDEWLSMLGKGLLMRSVAINSFGNSVMEVSAVRQTNVREEIFLPPDDYRKAGIEELLNILMGGPETIKPDAGEPELPKLPVKPRTTSPRASPSGPPY
ncbi:MAG: DUF4412 domain-containing protein [Bacteroidia bacterium]|nr:DUF4412 domain-containing protein [Bacteroidia bacterium]